MSTQSIGRRSRARSRLVRPGRPRVVTTYQLQAELGAREADQAAAFGAARQEILVWLANKAPAELPVEAKEGTSFVLEAPGQGIECVAIPQSGVWTCRLSHPDTGMGEVQAVPGRHWITDICLRRMEEKTLLGVQVSCSMLMTDDNPLLYARPAIVRNISRKTGLIQVCDLRHEPWTISRTKDIDWLENLLLAPERLLPVVVITEPDRKRWTLTPTPPANLVDIMNLARDLQGFVHVVRIPYEMGFEWTNKVGSHWAVFDGAVRLYQPGLDFDEDSFQQHPLYRKDLIWYHKYKDRTGPEAFANQLGDLIRAQNARGSWTAPELITTAQARLLETEIKAAQTREFAKTKEEAFQIALDRLTKTEREKSEASETAARMRELVKAKDDDIRALNERIKALEQAVQAAEDDSEKWSDLAQRADVDRDYHEKQNYQLRNQINALRASLESKTGESADQGLLIPDTYAEMENWAGENLSGRLELHPRTRRALKRACYEDVQLVYNSLLLLANEYRSMRLGNMEKAGFEEALNKLGLKLSGSIDPARAGAEGDTYFVEYPSGSRKKEFLEWHLQKGKIKDDQKCLRIYFFWHEGSQQVVVGWLPSHLDNQLS